MEDEDKRLKSERLLQLAIEACIDIVELIIIDQRLRAPIDGAQAIEILGEEKIIDSSFAKGFANAVGFRNILVHDYIEIDYEEVADKINNRLDDFDRFAKEVAQFSNFLMNINLHCHRASCIRRFGKGLIRYM